MAGFGLYVSLMRRIIHFTVRKKASAQHDSDFDSVNVNPLSLFLANWFDLMGMD